MYKKFVQRAGGYKCNPYIPLPEIRLCGVWLQEAGFETGKSVIVEYCENKIVIVLEEGEKDS